MRYLISTYFTILILIIFLPLLSLNAQIFSNSSSRNSFESVFELGGSRLIPSASNPDELPGLFKHEFNSFHGVFRNNQSSVILMFGEGSFNGQSEKLLAGSFDFQLGKFFQFGNRKMNAQIPFSLYSDYANWSKSLNLKKVELNATGLGISTGIAFDMQFASIHFSSKFSAGYGFAVQSISTESGWQSTFKNITSLTFPTVVGDFGLGISFIGGIQQWEIKEQPNVIIVYAGLSAGVCW